MRLLHPGPEDETLRAYEQTTAQRPSGGAPRRGYVPAIVMVVLLGAGMFALDRWVAETITAATVINVAWFAIVGGGFLLWARGAGTMTPIAGALGATVLIGGLTFYWTSVRDKEVNEDVVTATQSADSSQAQQALAGETATDDDDAQVQNATDPKPEQSGPANLTLASGAFAGADGHAGSGEATVIEQAGGDRTLTFTDFEVDPGAEVEVWLTPGAEETGDRIELGGLKGNVGDKQYEIPDDADLKYATVVLYCTPFTVRIAVAELDRA